MRRSRSCHCSCAGSIVTLGPEIEYAVEKTADSIEVRVYRGADGAFDLYEDEGDSYRYEQGAYTSIPMQWNEATGTFTIGERVGKFTGMVERRQFRVVLVAPGHGVGEEGSKLANATVEYSGKKIEIALTAKQR
jgi:alpha-D-xyloside xylohydrolase